MTPQFDATGKPIPDPSIPSMMEFKAVAPPGSFQNIFKGMQPMDWGQETPNWVVDPNQRGLPSRCPFCGGAQPVASYHARYAEWRVECQVCCIQTAGYPTAEGALQRWNARINPIPEPEPMAPSSPVLIDYQQRLEEIAGLLTDVEEQANAERQRFQAMIEDQMDTLRARDSLIHNLKLSRDDLSHQLEHILRITVDVQEEAVGNTPMNVVVQRAGQALGEIRNVASRAVNHIHVTGSAQTVRANASAQAPLQGSMTLAPGASYGGFAQDAVPDAVFDAGHE